MSEAWEAASTDAFAIPFSGASDAAPALDVVAGRIAVVRADRTIARRIAEADWALHRHERAWVRLRGVRPEAGLRRRQAAHTRQAACALEAGRGPVEIGVGMRLAIQTAACAAGAVLARFTLHATGAIDCTETGFTAELRARGVVRVSHATTVASSRESLRKESEHDTKRAWNERTIVEQILVAPQHREVIFKRLPMIVESLPNANG